MKDLQISNKDYATLNKIVNSSEWRDQNAVVGHLIKNYAHELIQISPSNIIIDSNPADNSALKTQEQWVTYFNQLKQQMISAPDIYHAGKTGSDEVLDSLRNDFDRSWEVSSTRISYNANDLGARITHNIGSIVTQPKQRTVVEIPVYKSESAKTVVEGKGLSYVRAYFDTKDKPNKIIDTLQKLSQKAPEDIKFWTPNQSSRKSYSERAAGFDCNFGGFRVSGDGFDDGSGRSRRVLINPRSGRVKK